ncbi:MAG: DoxX family protein [Bacteroides sp.]|nr:DoxX family protein [Ruminococcus flavefaciens]MCM1554466.1 DoxX family protein [Bacteroides sp.]
MNKQIVSQAFPSYAILALTLLLAIGIAFVPGLNWLFLLLLCANIVFCVLNRKRFCRSAAVLFRVLLGAVFVYSGFSKGVDPLGTQYMMHDYLEAFNMSWLNGLTLFGSFFLNVFEFTLGVLMICNVKIKYTAWLVAAMMAFFTLLTLNDAIAEPVPDCGCFGKALVITNWQTFYKNLVLDAGVLVMLFSLPLYTSRKSCKVEWSVIGITALIFVGFEYYNYRYLPVVNFLDWKEGVRLFPENPIPVRHYLTYRNIQTGEEREFLMSECPFSDPDWVESWEFVDRRDEDLNPRTANINILEKIDDEDPGYDVTKSLLEQENALVLVAVYDLDAADKKGVQKTAKFVRQAHEAGIDCCFLTASTVAEAEAFKQVYGLEDFPFYYADNTSIKAVIRSNPGIVLVKGAYVLKLWDWRRLPSFEKAEIPAD